MPDVPFDNLHDPLPVIERQSERHSERHSLNGPQSVPSRSNASSPLKRKPVLARKPTNLRAESVLGDGGRGPEVPLGDDPLLERFARLRKMQEPQHQRRPSTESAEHSRVRRPTSVSSSGDQHSLAEISSPQQLTPSFSNTTLPTLVQAPPASSVQSSARIPKGPRDMPTPNGVPSHPPKLPLATNFPDTLPRHPSPTYSPARNLPAPVTVDPPRMTARSLVGTGGRSSSLASARVPLPAPDTRADLSRRETPAYQNSHIPSKEPSYTMTISAESLFENLRQGSDILKILIIDVRPREAFDDGHIFATSIICIEPIALRLEISAEKIGDALVLSPENEQRLFNHRHTFDLVVYYDQCSGAGEGFGRPRRESQKLYHVSLREALWEFSQDKPLKQPPLLLEGGLDAWTDLVGRQALQASTTLLSDSRRRTELARRKRPEEMVNGQTVVENGDRRFYGHEGADINHDRLRQGHQEEGSDNERYGAARPNGHLINGTEPGRESPAPLRSSNRQLSRTYDDFLRRFPEPSEIKVSMVTSSPVLERTIIDHPFHNFTGVTTPQRQTPPADPNFEPAPSGPPSRPPPAVPRQSYSGVSERAHYSLPPPPRPPTVGASRPSPFDTISSRPAHQVGRTGLTNFGATCYMNSVMQCLSATSPLTRYFLDGSFKGALQRNNRFGSKGELPDVYATLMWHLWSGSYTHVSPKSFRVSIALLAIILVPDSDLALLQEMVSRLNRDFENPDVQHDAHDFLIFLLDALHEDLNVNCSRTRLNDLTPAEERKRESMPVQIASRVEWKRWSHRNASWVSSLFGGQHLSRLQCPVCGCTSTSYETFYTISLEIPRKGKAHLYDCLKNYTKEERLGPDDPWTCPNCKVPREATKRITITRAPQILVIQLKRFKSVRRGFTDKSNTLVDFPLTGLDLTPFSVPPPSFPNAQDAEARYGPSASESDDQTTPPFEYDAYGVVQHFGTLTGGHYTALVRGSTGGQWFEFNDRVISNFGTRHVPSAAAYLLFYVRSKVQ